MWDLALRDFCLQLHKSHNIHTPLPSLQSSTIENHHQIIRSRGEDWENHIQKVLKVSSIELDKIKMVLQLLSLTYFLMIIDSFKRWPSMMSESEHNTIWYLWNIVFVTGIVPIFLENIITYLLIYGLLILSVGFKVSLVGRDSARLSLLLAIRLFILLSETKYNLSKKINLLSKKKTIVVVRIQWCLQAIQDIQD